MSAIGTINSGIPLTHKPFWESMTLYEFARIYKIITATPAKVLSLVEEPLFLNQSEKRDIQIFKAMHWQYDIQSSSFISEICYW